MNGAGEQGVDALISRVVDGDATEAQWSAFRSLAEKDPSLWRELAECQRDHVELAADVAAAIAVAERVDAPVHEEIGRRFAERVRLVATWGGWAAAAVVALAWFTGGLGGVGPTTGGSQAAVFDPGKLKPQDVLNQYVTDGKLSPAELYQGYLDAGQQKGLVVGELPDRVLITTRPMKAGGGYEVVYLRQIMERTRVKELSGVGYTDWGQMVPIPFEVRQPGESGRY